MLQQIGVKGIFLRGREFLALYLDQNGIRYWDLPGGRLEFGETIESAVKFIYPVQWLNLAELVPNNLFLNGDKVERLRAVSVEDFEERIPPVIVSRIDGQFALIDGHSRAYCAYEKGLHHIRARMYPLEQIGGSPSLYRRIHEIAISSGITDVGKLSDRMLYGQDHRDKWVAYCDSLLAELGGGE